MNLSMEYKGKVFGFELFTDRRNKRQLWMDQDNYQEWENSTAQLEIEERQQEEYEFFANIQDHLESLESYELFIDKWNTPEPNAYTLNWYIDDSVDE